MQVPCLPAGRDACSGHKKSSTKVGDFYFKICRFPACRQAGMHVLGTKNPQQKLGIFILRYAGSRQAGRDSCSWHKAAFLGGGFLLKYLSSRNLLFLIIAWFPFIFFFSPSIVPQNLFASWRILSAVKY